MINRAIIPGHPLYGHAVGIIMQNDSIVRLPGDVGNATTFKFPVRYALVPGVGGNDLKDPANLERIAPAYIDAARQLEQEGIKMLAAGCGFSGILQPILNAQVNIPVFTSSLMQVPLISQSIGGGAIGILTADSRILDDRYFKPLGWDCSSLKVRVWGIEEEKDFLDVLFEGGQSSIELLQRGNSSMRRIALEMINRYPEIRAIVMECTNLPPFSAEVSAATGLPVFDIVTLIKWAYSACIPKVFQGYC